MVHIEVPLVCDELRAAGTADRLLRPLYTVEEKLHDDPLHVGDVKTGTSNQYFDEYAIQFAIYAHSQIYNIETGERTPVNINQKIGYLIHQPQGEPVCDVYTVDIEAGWEAALLAADVKAFQKKRGMVVAA
jgi:hypothetical protein